MRSDHAAMRSMRSRAVKEHEKRSKEMKTREKGHGGVVNGRHGLSLYRS